MQRVLYTVNVGGYDKLRPAPRLAGWRCVYFSDRPLPLWARLRGNLGWEVRRLEASGDEQPSSLLSREPKLLPHRFLADFDYSLYVDANIVLKDDPTALLDRLGWPDVLAARHPYRATLAEEVDSCIAENKAPADVLRAQVEAYRAGGLPRDALLYENNVLARRHNAPAAVRLAEAWWQAFLAHPHRDQLSLPWAVHATGVAPAVLEQAEKRQVFQAKAHDRAMLRRWRRSIAKRLGRRAAA